MEHRFICERCGRIHVLNRPIVDEIITCKCGFRFYCFGNNGMKIILPEQELLEKVCEMIRRFVQATGRCRDAPAPPSETEDIRQILRRMDSAGLLEIALQKMQEEDFGVTLLHCNDIESILEILHEDKDAVVKELKGYVSVKELKSRNHRKSETDYLQLMENTLAAVQENETVCREEIPLKQWQIDIMEENARRTGLLFGESG